MSVFFDIIRDGSHFSCRADGGEPFAIGARVRYRTRSEEKFGLSNDAGTFANAYAAKYLYRAADFEPAFRFWATFIEPTAICEGQSFISLNTYDRAHFTFGFGQFAAHVPNGDFVLWFRDMLSRPEARNYFPNLEIQDGRVVKLEDNTARQLESDETTAPLQSYLNPSLTEVEDAEVIAAAKLIHWTVHFEGARLLQAQHMIATAKGLVKRADRRLGLDGKAADLCCVAMDILHQGRGGFDEMQRALLSSDPFEAILEVGSRSENGRVKNLRAALKSRRPALAAKVWSRQNGDFV